MKRILLLLAVVVVGCYDDDSTLIQSEDVAHTTSELTSNIKSIALHDASFDDIVDYSPCLSIDFPYELYVNSEIRIINSVIELGNIEDNDIVEIIYPVTITQYDYDTYTITSAEQFDVLRNTCENSFNIDANPCLDFQYPLQVRMFNPISNTFQAMNVNHDQEIFMFLNSLQDTDVYEIDYPISLQDHTSNTTPSITSNIEFENIFDVTLMDCQ